MKVFNIKFFKKGKKIKIKEETNFGIDEFYKIGKLVKDARLKKNLSIKELSDLSKIPESSIKAIENNIQNQRPEYPFIRSILLKIEECLSLNKNTLVGISNKYPITSRKDDNNYIIRKFDFINSWQGSILYFLFLILTLFLINRYYISNIKIIDFQIIEEKAKEK